MKLLCYNFDQQDEEIEIIGNILVISHEVPSRIELIIEPRPPGLDRERRVLEYKSEVLKEFIIPDELLEKTKNDLSNYKLDVISINYYIQNETKILNSLDLFDWDDFNSYF